MGSDVPATANEAGLVRPATSDHPEGEDAGPGGSSASSEANGGELGDNAPPVAGSIADPEPSMLTRLLIMFSDLRAQVVGGR